MAWKLLPGQPRKLYWSSAASLGMSGVLGILEKALDKRSWVLFSGLVLLAVLLFIVGKFSMVLYYVRAGESWMDDWHDPGIGGPRAKRKPAARWAQTLIRPSVLDGLTVEDQSVPATELAENIRNQVAADRATSWQLAPNLLLPVGMAVGYELGDLTRSSKLNLVESMGRPRDEGAVTKTQGGLPQASGPDIVRPHDDYYSWPFESAVTPPSACEGLQVRLATGAAPGSLVIADLTNRDSTTAPTDVHYGSRYRLAAFRVAGGDIDGERQTVKMGDRDADPEGHLLCQPGPLVQQLGQMIRQAVHNTSSGAVFLALRVPKTISVAVGMYLRISACQTPGCTLARCQNPWNVLVPLNYNMRQATYSPWRVSRHQPSVADMVTLINSGRHHA